MQHRLQFSGIKKGAEISFHRHLNIFNASLGCFIEIFSRKATDFHRQWKLFELNFVIYVENKFPPGCQTYLTGAFLDKKQHSQWRFLACYLVWKPNNTWDKKTNTNELKYCRISRWSCLPWEGRLWHLLSLAVNQLLLKIFS